jgi:regulator of sigma E protease
MTLAQRLLLYEDQEIDIRVQRDAADQPLDLRITRQPPSTFVDAMGAGAPIALESLGLALRVENVIAEVDGPAKASGLQAGDQIVKVQVVPTNDRSREEAESRFGRNHDEPMKLGEDVPSWPYIFSYIQQAVPGSEVKLTYIRDDQERTATVSPVDSTEWYYADRGMRLSWFSQVHTAASWGEACRLGLRETKENLSQVLTVLHRLVTRQVSYKNIGGPIMIIMAAGSEASEGIPRLLIFLTFLSANLAVLNFLPIPALDGGHMVFLAAEWVRGKPVDERLQVALTLVGVFCLLSLMVLVFALDIDRFFL